MTSKLLKFTRILKNGNVFYRFEDFENIDSRWELPCEYLSGAHFAAWDGILLYSDGKTLFSLACGSELSESAYSELMLIVDTGKERLREIRNRNSF
ncbi:hypothetical protein EQO05_12420 [Methanosarcina sp. MSH10X1]|uniref:hypothetical protein n=1 Tax=Methanosarcina sp. MSH10X1 TaxID=2507075 RepID=UPI000FFBA57B|nr:hypothetical protein [Methanosarcina sp. MSH10X1]RXA17234.1 hypothetical protein EQO05_12420 [Methanosarcina sp. MSH10X1]